MSGVSSRVSKGCRFAIFGLATAATVFVFTIDDADARGKRKRASVRQGGGYTPPYASIVVDANTGRVLQDTNSDAARRPASLTKIMTLYLLFERLEAGKIKLDTPMTVSARAAAQSPTKLGLRPGSTIAVEDAIRGLVTKSANDAAVVVAETLGGSEDAFAGMMTRKARALGMSKTTYRNASGLPNDEQLTTARDQATLGRAIQERFPRYYRYFSTSQFTYRGSTMRNHNHLLGRVEGVDGIKTGYTNASGFNLVTSVRRNGRHIVAVVLGGTSAGARDARMRGLIEDKIADASTKRTVTAIAEASVPAEPMELRPAARKVPAPAPQPAGRTTLASAESTPITLAELTEAAIAAAPTAPTAAPANTAPRTGSLDPIRPIAVKTVKVKLNTRTAALVAPASAVKPAVDDSLPTQSLDIAEPVKAELPKAEPVKPAAPAITAKSEPPASPSRNAHVASGWIIQIGAFGGESEAKQRLSAAQSKVKTLGRADPFTEAVTKGDKTFYRARFAGFEKDQAEAVCKQLKRNDFACLAIKN